MTAHLPVAHQLVIAQTALSIATHDLKYPLMAIQRAPDCSEAISEMVDDTIAQLGLIGRLNRRKRPTPRQHILSELFETVNTIRTSETPITYIGNMDTRIHVPSIHWETAFALFMDLPCDSTESIVLQVIDADTPETMIHVHHPLFNHHPVQDLFDPKPRHIAPDSIGLMGLLIKTLWLTCGCWVTFDNHPNSGPIVVLRVLER